MIKDRPVRASPASRRRTSRSIVAALKVGMDAKTARKYRDSDALPSQRRVTPSTWRTREDPFQDVWPELVERSGSTRGSRPRPSSTTCSAASRAGSPTSSSAPCNGGSKRGGPSKGRPRRCSSPRSTSRAARRLATSPAWTSCGVTIAGQPFDHLVYHFVLTYSNWEAGTVCFSESFESLSEGLQNALWELGGVPRRHRTDRLTAAVNNLGDPRLFTRRYRALLAHYGLKPRRSRPAQANENGDVEQSHHRFKQAVDQALMLRGSRDFAGRAAYERFLQQAHRPAQQRTGTSGSPRNGRCCRLCRRGGWMLARRAGRGSTRGARSTSAATPTRCPAD